MNRKQADTVAADLSREIARIKKSPTVDARMQALRDGQDARERRERAAAVKAAASEPIVTGVDIYKVDRRRAQDQKAQAVYDNAASPSVGSLSSRNGPWFRSPKVSMPTDIATSKGAQVFAAAQQGDVEAQRIVKAAVECVADQVQRAIAIHAATTGGRVNKAAGVDTTPNTTLGPHGMSAAELAGLVATAQQLTKPLRTTLQSADSTLDPQFMDRIRERAKIRIDPATMQVIRPISPTTHTSGDPDNRPGLSDRTGSPA